MCSSSSSKFLIIPDYRRALVPPPTTRNSPREAQFHFEARNRTHKFVLLSQRQKLWVSEPGNDASDEEEEEAEASSYSDEESSFLSLNVKPDRNMSLLDDYELEELDYTDPSHRSGYVAVLGKPNVGKSILANQMIGQKLSIVTDKPQITRHRVLGICSGPEEVVLGGLVQRLLHMPDVTKAYEGRVEYGFLLGRNSHVGQ